MEFNVIPRRLDVLCGTKQVQKAVKCRLFNSSSSLGSGRRKMCPRSIIEQRVRIHTATACRFIHTGRCLYNSESPQDTENNTSHLKVIDYTVFTKKPHPNVLDDAEKQSRMQAEKSVDNQKKHQKNITKC